MNNKIDIAGIQLDNYSAREAIAVAEKMLGNKEFITIEEVDMETLKSAEHNSDLKIVLEDMGCTVITDVGVLRAVGTVSAQRKYEIENRDFFYGLMERIEKTHKRVYIITSDEARLNVIGDFLTEEFPRMNVEGVSVMRDTENFSDELINEINSLGVDVILSVLTSPAQEMFIQKYKGMLLAGLWYGVGFNNFTSKRNGVSHWIKYFIDVHRLALHIRKRDSDI